MVLALSRLGPCPAWQPCLRLGCRAPELLEESAPPPPAPPPPPRRPPRFDHARDAPLPAGLQPTDPAAPAGPPAVQPTSRWASPPPSRRRRPLPTTSSPTSSPRQAPALRVHAAAIPCGRPGHRSCSRGAPRLLRGAATLCLQCSWLPRPLHAASLSACLVAKAPGRSSFTRPPPPAPPPFPPPPCPRLLLCPHSPLLLCPSLPPPQEVDKVELIYTKFVSLISSSPVIQTLLPLSPSGEVRPRLARLPGPPPRLVPPWARAGSGAAQRAWPNVPPGCTQRQNACLYCPPHGHTILWQSTGRAS